LQILEDKYNHCIDSLRYALNSNIKFSSSGDFSNVDWGF